MASRKITCLITGKSYTYGQDYYNKKVSDYIDETNLKKYFITQKAKNYLDYARCVRLLGRSSGIFHLVERFRTQLSQQELEPTHTAVLRVVLGARRDVGARG